MRVLFLFDADSSDRPESGLVTGLAARGIEVCVACTPGTPFDAAVRAAGLNVVPVPFRSKIDVSAIRAIRAILRGHAVDVVHAFHKVTLTNALIARRGLGIPVVAYRGIVGNLSYWDPFAWMGFLNPGLDRIVCVCDAVRDYVCRKRLLGVFRIIDPQRVVTLRKGHRLEWYRQAEPPDLASLGVPPGAFVVGVIARLKHRKGIHVLVDAMDVLDRRPDIHLLVVGRAFDRSVPDAVRRSRSKDRIHMAGFRSDAAALAGACHVVAAPSLRREGVPRAVVEGMAQGVPALVTDVGGSPELVRDGVDGRVVPPGDARALAEAIAWLAEDPDRRTGLGRNAQERIDTAFNLDRTIELTRRLYEGLPRRPDR